MAVDPKNREIVQLSDPDSVKNSRNILTTGARKVQYRTSWDVSIPKEWASILDIEEPGDELFPVCILGYEPVLITQPVLLFRPKNQVEGNE